MRGRSIVVAGVAMAVMLLGGAMTTSTADAMPFASGARHSTAHIVVSARRTMVDEPVGVSVIGVAPGAVIQIRLTIVAGGQTLANGQMWTSQAVFRADRWGRVNVATDAPIDGDYQGIDPMGLFWSARTTTLAAPPPREPWVEHDQLSVAVGGEVVASTDLVRFFMRPSGAVRAVREQGVVGTLFAPAAGGRHPAVIVVGGSEGGKTFSELRAALLASRGYTALALAYFDPTGVLPLPPDLSLLPLEYFANALDWLTRQPSVDASRVGVIGDSRGGELALLLGSRFPQLKSVIAVAPSSVVWSGLSYTDPGAIFRSAWTQNGQPIPFLVPKIDGSKTPFDWYVDALDTPEAQQAEIPVEQINGPVLLLSGADDQLWPAPKMATRIIERLRARGHPYDDEHINYSANGHVIQLPNEPTTQLVPPGFPNGGDAVGSARAAVDSWNRTLDFLDENLACASPRTSASPIERRLDWLFHWLCRISHRSSAPNVRRAGCWPCGRM